MVYTDIFNGLVSGVVANDVFAEVTHQVRRYLGMRKTMAESAAATIVAKQFPGQPIISIPPAIGYCYNLIETAN